MRELFHALLYIHEPLKYNGCEKYKKERGDPAGDRSEMYCVKELRKDLYWVGATDRKISLFENMYPVPDGMSYDSYLFTGEKTVLVDTADKAVARQFFENIAHVLGGRDLDYLIINHMEPDHCATLGDLLLRYPNVRIISNAKVLGMIKQFFDFDPEDRFDTVKENDEIEIGDLRFRFFMTPMVHWPEVMMTYESTGKTLFSADAFGVFGPLDGHIFAEETDYEMDVRAEARRYYSNIVGRYGPQVQAALKKTADLEIEMVCPLHGFIWKEDFPKILSDYEKWSRYEPEVKGCLILVGSIYGNTENAANILAMKLAEKGVRDIKIRDVCSYGVSNILSDAFRYSHIVFASVTHDSFLFEAMENVIHEMTTHNLQNRTIGVIENGSWVAQSGKRITEIVQAMKNMTLIEEKVSLKSSVKEENLAQIEALADRIAISMKL